MESCVSFVVTLKKGMLSSVRRQLEVDLERHVVIQAMANGMDRKVTPCRDHARLRRSGCEMEVVLDTGQPRTKVLVFRSAGEAAKFERVLNLEKAAGERLHKLFGTLTAVGSGSTGALAGCGLETMGNLSRGGTGRYVDFFEVFLLFDPAELASEWHCASKLMQIAEGTGTPRSMPGEKALHLVERVEFGVEGAPSCFGMLRVTNFRLRLTADDAELSLPHGATHRVESGRSTLRLWCRGDGRCVMLRFDADESVVDLVRKTIDELSFPRGDTDSQRLEGSFALHYRLRCDLDGWTVYSAPEEYARLGLVAPLWRVWSDSYQLVETYPLEFVVPRQIADDTLREAAAYRSKRRLPAAVWRSRKTGAVLCRSSQPLAGLSKKSSRADQALLELYRTRGADTNRPLHIVDCRGRAAALGNRAQGKGTESVSDYRGATLTYCDIGNIHTMRDSQQALLELLRGSDDDAGYLSALEAAGWLRHLLLVLKAALFVAKRLEFDGASVLVHCSDGWDRTAQVSALAQLLLDPHYRSRVGFAALVTKEWCSFGHKFADRVGVYRKPDTRSNERSPVFLQFLEAVEHLRSQFPLAFEFDDDLLVFLADAAHAGLFGTFLGDSERQRNWEMRAPKRTVSVWTYVLNHPTRFRNPAYAPHPGPLWPRCTLRRARTWDRFYARWDPNSRPTPGLHPTSWTFDYGDDFHFHDAVAANSEVAEKKCSLSPGP